MTGPNGVADSFSARVAVEQTRVYRGSKSSSFASTFGHRRLSVHRSLNECDGVFGDFFVSVKNLSYSSLYSSFGTTSVAHGCSGSL